MATEFKLPELGEGVESADVSRIYVSEGDEIEADQTVMELETEKAVADLPCPHGGKVTKIRVAEGDTIEVGQTLLAIEEAAEESGEASDSEQSAQEDVAQEDVQRKDRQTDAKDESKEVPSSDEEVVERESTAAEQQGEDDGQRVPPPAGPATRRLARKLGVDLNDFEPTEGDRIRTEDIVRAYIESGRAAAGLSAEPLPDFTRFGPVDREPLNRIAQTAARRLSAAWRIIPHVTQHGLADVTDLEAARRAYMEHADNAAVKITLTSIAVKCVAGLLKEFPKFNASLDTTNEELILKRHYHIGVAVDTDHGLLVPVIRDVDRKSIEQIATELRDVADSARRHELGMEDFEGGTFTVSNQGGIGGGEFTPIVNHPEVAILGMGRTRPELRLIEGTPAERLMLPLSLSYDHRVINGADAARFIDRLTDILSDEFRLLIAT